jgi:putative ABC transport system permease protein
LILLGQSTSYAGQTRATGLSAKGLAKSQTYVTNVLSSMHCVTATDPLTFGGTVMLLLALSAVAGYLPARRAARVDPIAVLRV